MSDKFDEFKEIFKKFDSEYRSWVKENSANFPPHKIDHGAFTMQEASMLLLEFSETIKIVLEDKEQCLKYVSRDEIIAINTDLDKLLIAATQNNYSCFAKSIGELIPCMRPFHLLSMEKMDEKRYREIKDMDKTLREIKIIQEIITNTANKAKSDSEDLHNSIESITERNTEIDGLFSGFDKREKQLIYNRNTEIDELISEKITEIDELTSEKILELDELINEKNTELDGSISNSNTALDNMINKNNQKMNDLAALHENVDQLNNCAYQIYDILKDANEQKLEIDRFIKSIQEREEKITSQNVATEEHEKKLRGFSEKYDLNMKKAEQLIELATSGGLSGAFRDRQKKLANRGIKLAWLAMGMGAIGIAVGIGYMFLDTSLNIETLVGRTLLMTVLIAVAAFCSKQYAKNRSLEEDYAYKVALVGSYHGFANEFKDAEETRKEYVVKLLEEVLQDPQRARHDKESLVDSHPLMAELKKFLKKNETKTDESKKDKEEPPNP